MQVHQIGMTEEGLFDMGELHVLLRVITISRVTGKVCLTILQHLIQFPKIFFPFYHFYNNIVAAFAVFQYFFGIHLLECACGNICSIKKE